jgi:hypothetical protein
VTCSEVLSTSTCCSTCACHQLIALLQLIEQREASGKRGRMDEDDDVVEPHLRVDTSMTLNPEQRTALKSASSKPVSDGGSTLAVVSDLSRTHLLAREFLSVSLVFARVRGLPESLGMLTYLSTCRNYSWVAAPSTLSQACPSPSEPPRLCRSPVSYVL